MTRFIATFTLGNIWYVMNLIKPTYVLLFFELRKDKFSVVCLIIFADDTTAFLLIHV